MQTPPGFRGAFRTDDLARSLYSEGAGIYRIVPAAVAVPADRDDVARLLRWAADSGTPLVPRGAGSGMPGGNVGPGVVVDLTRAFREPPRVEPGQRRVRVGASMTYRELNDSAARHRLRLPPDPSSGAFCTIGGMVSTNAAGAHSLKYGAMRQWIEAVEFITADGETGRAGREDLRPERATTAAERRLLSDVAPYLRSVQRSLEQAPPRTRKNSSGYQLVRNPDDGWVRHLLIGSEGTLGVVTAVELRLAPLPTRLSTLLVTLRSLGDVAPAVDALGPFAPSAVELLDRTYLDLVREAAPVPIPADTEAVLLVEIEGDARSAQPALAGIAASTVVADGSAAAELWELRHLASPILAALPETTRSLQLVEDGCVPPARLGEYVAGLRKIAADCGFEIVIFGHAGDANVHANLLADVGAPDLAPRLERCLRETSHLQLALDGTTTGEHGDGRLRAPFLERLYGPTYFEACRRVKAAFDPKGILNPGVKLPLPGPSPALRPDQLKVGAAAPLLPPEAATAMRQVERDAAWGTFKLDLIPATAASV